MNEKTYKIVGGFRTIKRLNDGDFLKFDDNVRVTVQSYGFLITGRHGNKVYYNDEEQKFYEVEYGENEILFVGTNTKGKR